MKKIIVGFLVLLAVCSLSLTLVPGAFSQTQNIKIVSYSYYIDSIGLLVVVGEVQNVGSNTVDKVLVTGTVSSSDGHQANSGIYAWVNNLIPQQKAPFYLEFSSDSSSDGSWTSDISNVAISVYQADATVSYQYQDLTITKKSATQTSDGVFWVNGDIQNTGTQTASNITVVAAFYNSTGATVAVGYTYPLTPANLGPSGTTSFKVGAFDLNQTGIISEKKITDYSLLIQVQAPILQGTAPVISVTPTPGSITVATPGPTSPSTSSQGSQSGTTTNSSTSPQLIYAIVIVVAIVAVAAAFLLLKKRGKPEQVSKPAKTKK